LTRSFWDSLFGRQFRLGGKREKRVLDLIAEHLAMVQRCAKELNNMISSVEQMNWALVKSQAEIVSRYESMADDLHRQAVVQIAQGAFFAGMREDFLDLIEKVDEIADASQDAARVMSEAPIERRVLDFLYEGDSTLHQFVDGIDTSITTLAESIESLRTDAEAAVKKALEVERVEEAVDQIKADLISKLSTHRREIDVLAYLQVKELIFRLDEIADAAENCSDLVITIVVKAVS
jgi:predicted phosphate transport protein (TIGR00153 family)